MLGPDLLCQGFDGFDLLSGCDLDEQFFALKVVRSAKCKTMPDLSARLHAIEQNFIFNFARSLSLST
jgi:hypothetical protein